MDWVRRWLARYRVTPTVTGFGFVVLGGLLLAGALVQRVNLLMLIGAMLVGLALTSLWVTDRWLRGLSATRVLPADMYADRPFRVTVELRNDRERTPALGVVVEDGLSRVLPKPATSVGRLRLRVPFPIVHAGDEARMPYEVPGLPRGVYRCSTLRLRTRFPLGLFERYAPVPELAPAEFVVRPLPGVFHPAVPVDVAYQPTPTRQFQRTELQQDEFHGLREYREGDNPRHIHWRTSARRGKPMVRLYEQEVSRETILLVEPWSPTRPDSDAAAAIELLIALACDMCAEMHRWSGLHLAMAIGSAEPRVLAGSANSRMLQGCLRELVSLEGSPEADWQRAWEALAPSQQRASHVWLVTTRNRPGTAADIADRLGSRAATARIEVLNVTGPYLARVYDPAKPAQTKEGPAVGQQR